MSKLPSGWCLSKFSDLGDWSSGGTPSREVAANFGGDIPWVKTGDLHHAYLDKAEEFITEQGLRYSAAKVFPKGSLLVAMYGATIGQTAVLKIDAATNQACAALISAGSTKDVIPYVWKFLIARQEELRQAGQGGAQPNISQGILRALSIPVPPLAEQQRIVAQIDSLSAQSARSRDHLNHIPRLVQKYKQAVSAAALRGDLTKQWRVENPSAIWKKEDLQIIYEHRRKYLESRRGSRLQFPTEIGGSNIPKGWYSGHLADVGRLQVGYAYKSKWYTRDGVRLLRGVNVSPGRVSWDEEVRLPDAIADDFSEYRLDAGDIVLAMDRPIISAGLKVARIASSDAGCLLVQRVARYVSSDMADQSFIWHAINSNHFIDHAVTQATGSDLPHISSNDILTTPLAIPCKSEQQEVVRRIETALTWIDRLAAEATSARKLVDQLEKAVLNKAFRGELVPQDANDEPASVLLDCIRAERAVAPRSRRGGRARAQVTG